ncbi:MAG: molybdenum cofactor biosynthesis protein MoaE [Microbacteriaceae bacterium]
MPDSRGEVFALVTTETLDAASLESFVLDDTHGALVTFRGVIRNHDHDEAVTGLDYSAHPDAESFVRAACVAIEAEFDVRVAAAHRIGSLTIGDIALVAAVSSAHRAEAFAACAKLVDSIKLTVPIWKRQHLTKGNTEWVGI